MQFTSQQVQFGLGSVQRGAEVERRARFFYCRKWECETPLLKYTSGYGALYLIARAYATSPFSSALLLQDIAGFVVVFGTGRIHGDRFP